MNVMPGWGIFFAVWDPLGDMRKKGLFTKMCTTVLYGKIVVLEKEPFWKISSLCILQYFLYVTSMSPLRLLFLLFNIHSYRILFSTAVHVCKASALENKNVFS